MGAWGLGYFENDGACDFTVDLAERPNWEPILAAFERVNGVSPESYLENPECEVGIAAAAIVAHLAGKMSTDIEERSAINKLGSPSEGVVTAARVALTRILQDSELKELWEEEGLFDDWIAAMKPLVQALA